MSINTILKDWTILSSMLIGIGNFSSDVIRAGYC